jgi:hypothetical protein
MRLALIVLLISACDVHDEHHIEASWSIDRYGDGVATTADGTPGASVACPSGWTTVRLVAVDPSAPQTRSVDTFSCDAQQGTSSYLAADSYVAWLEVADGNKVLASSPPTTTEVTSFNPILIADIYLDAGYATVAWPPVTEQVMIELTGPTAVTTYFDSSAGAGLIGPVPPGRYQVAASVGSRREMLPDLVITAPNGLADLGMLSIP